MSLRDELGLLTPRLRRYAQALSTAPRIPNETADALVQRTLTHALQTGPLSPRSDMTVWLYSLLTQFHRDTENRLRATAGDSQGFYNSSINDKAYGRGLTAAEGLGAGLAALSLDEREALLLVVLEGFSYSQSSHILRISRGMLIARLIRAREAFANAMEPKGNPSSLPNSLPSSSPNSSQKRPSYLRVIK